MSTFKGWDGETYLTGSIRVEGLNVFATSIDGVEGRPFGVPRNRDQVVYALRSVGIGPARVRQLVN